MSVTFAPGDAHALPFEAGAFDVAVCLRVLMHTPDWARCVGELCRVARHRVVLDYPALLSAAALQSVGRRAAAAFGRGRGGVPRAAGSAPSGASSRGTASASPPCTGSSCCRSRCTSACGSRAATERIEAALARAGLLRLLGSPVTVMAER